MEKFLKQQVSSDVPGTYVPPIYQLPGKSVSEVRMNHDMDVLSDDTLFTSSQLHL